MSYLLCLPKGKGSCDDRMVNSKTQRQYKVRVSGKMQLLQKKFEVNSPTQNKLTGQKQLLKRKEAALVTL